MRWQMVECNCCVFHAGYPAYHCEVDPTFPEARALGWQLRDGDFDICPSCIDCKEKI